MKFELLIGKMGRDQQYKYHDTAEAENEFCGFCRVR